MATSIDRIRIKLIQQGYMRKIACCLCLALAFATGCVKTNGGWQTLVPPSQIVSYPSGDNQFVIIAVEDNDVTAAQAKQAARSKAAQVTLDNGYRYFSIVSESEIQVVKTSPSDASQVPSNLYQEYIVEKQFGRDSLSKNQPGSTDTYPAIRLTIECYTEKPGMRNSIDAQKFLNQ